MLIILLSHHPHVCVFSHMGMQTNSYFLKAGDENSVCCTEDIFFPNDFIHLTTMDLCYPGYQEMI